MKAALIQRTDSRGMQPEHLISWTMAETKNRYSQPKKDALEIKWPIQRKTEYLPTQST